MARKPHYRPVRDGLTLAPSWLVDPRGYGSSRQVQKRSNARVCACRHITEVNPKSLGFSPLSGFSVGTTESARIRF